MSADRPTILPERADRHQFLPHNAGPQARLEARAERSEAEAVSRRLQAVVRCRTVQGQELPRFS
jgi:hypothetical protein